MPARWSAGRPGRAADLTELGAWCGLDDEVADVLWYSARRFDHHRHAPLAARLLAVAHEFDELTAAREYHVPLQADTRQDCDCPRGRPPVLPGGRDRADGGAARSDR